MPFDPLETVPVELLPDGRLRTLEPFTWTGTRGDTVLVPAGTITDLASVPWFLRGVIAHDGRIARAAIVHDVLCERLRTYEAEVADYRFGRPSPTGWTWEGPEPTPPTFSAVDADGVFWLILAELDVAPVRRALYWEGVRAGALTSSHRRAGWWQPRQVGAFLALLPLVLLVLPGAVGSLLSGLLVAAAGVLCGPFDRAPRRRRGDAATPAGPGGVVYRRRARLELGADTVRATSAARVSDDDGERPPLTGTELERAERERFGLFAGGDLAEVRAFRAGWRQARDIAAAAAERDRLADAFGRAVEAAGGRVTVLEDWAPPVGTPLQADADGCTCHAGWEGVHSLLCPLSAVRRPWAARAGRWLAAAPGRAVRAIGRGLRALGRGVAAFLSALFDAL